MKNNIVLVLLLMSALLFHPQTVFAEHSCTLEINIEGIIGPGMTDYIERSIRKATEEKCQSILALMNTPGGNLESTHIIVEKILNSPMPFLCVVAPEGARAGSAGAIILQACHVNGALEATHLGAATPIMGSGQNIPGDLRKKMLNDTVSWLEGITTLRKRNLDFSKKIITEAKAVSSEGAYKIKAIDILSKDIDDFLKQAKTKKAIVGHSEQAIHVGSINIYKPDSRFFILQILSDPEISYLVFMGSIALLYFEFTHPGLIAPGVVGSIGLVLSLMSFHKLDVWWGGLALILLGMIMLILEMFVPSFGALGVGGIIAFILGGVFLFDTTQTAYHLPLMIILPTAILLGLIMIGIGYLVLRNRNLKVRTGSEEMMGKKGKVKNLESPNTGQAYVLGELWKFESADELEEHDEIEVTGVQGLTLKVKKVRSNI